MERTVLFVCLHGAAKSRLAAAFFTNEDSSGWRALSAGLEPDESVSEHAVRLLEGDPAAALLDRTAPRPIDGFSADLVVAIDCDVAGANRWDLTDAWPSEQARDELRARSAALARELSLSPDRSDAR